MVIHFVAALAETVTDPQRLGFSFRLMINAGKFWLETRAQASMLVIFMNDIIIHFLFTTVVIILWFVIKNTIRHWNVNLTLTGS